MMYHDEHDKKALNALAADMGLHDPANVDAALGLPLVMLGSDATARLNAITENGTKPGAHTACRTDAASLSDAEAAVKACEVVERAAHHVLVNSGLTPDQIVLLSAFTHAQYKTRSARLDLEYERRAEIISSLWKGGAK
jgi:hypothetical protein